MSNGAPGLSRVVNMAREAEKIHAAESLGAIRPDLLDEDPEYARLVAAQRKARVLAAAIRPTGPRYRLSKIGVVRKRIELGLS